MSTIQFTRRLQILTLLFWLTDSFTWQIFSASLSPLPPSCTTHVSKKKVFGRVPLQLFHFNTNLFNIALRCTQIATTSLICLIYPSIVFATLALSHISLFYFPRPPVLSTDASSHLCSPHARRRLRVLLLLRAHGARNTSTSSLSRCHPASRHAQSFPSLYTNTTRPAFL